MALVDAATLVIGAGNYFTAPVGTAYPASLDAISTPWANLGHTSIEDIMSFESDGGDATVLGTLQNSALRTTYSKRTESFGIGLQQFDEDALKFYYGSNAVVNETTGLLEVPSNPAPTQVAFLAVFVDGANKFTLYCPKAEIFRADNLEISDTESLVTLPLKVTPIQHGTNTFTYAISPLAAA